MDFGIARSGSSQAYRGRLDHRHRPVPVPRTARHAGGPSADLYSTGIVLYEMLTGSVPFTGDTPLEVAMQHLSEVPEPPSAKRPEIPHELDAIVLRALEPGQRYESARDMDADPDASRRAVRLAGDGGGGHRSWPA